MRKTGDARLVFLFFLDGLAYENNTSANCLKHLPPLGIQILFVTETIRDGTTDQWSFLYGTSGSRPFRYNLPEPVWIQGNVQALHVHKLFEALVVEGKLKLAIFGVLSIATVLTGCSSKPAQQAGGAGAQAMPVQTVTIEPQPVARGDEYVSTIKSRRSATITPQVVGNLIKIAVRSGDVEKVGGTLAQAVVFRICNNAHYFHWRAIAFDKPEMLSERAAVAEKAASHGAIDNRYVCGLI